MIAFYSSRSFGQVSLTSLLEVVSQSRSPKRRSTFRPRWSMDFFGAFCQGLLVDFNLLIQLVGFFFRTKPLKVSHFSKGFADFATTTLSIHRMFDWILTPTPPWASREVRPAASAAHPSDLEVAGPARGGEPRAALVVPQAGSFHGSGGLFGREAGGRRTPSIEAVFFLFRPGFGR